MLVRNAANEMYPPLYFYSFISSSRDCRHCTRFSNRFFLFDVRLARAHPNTIVRCSVIHEVFFFLLYVVVSSIQPFISCLPASYLHCAVMKGGRFLLVRFTHQSLSKWSSSTWIALEFFKWTDAEITIFMTILDFAGLILIFFSASICWMNKE